MKVKIFWQENCPDCSRAKKLGKQLEDQNILVEYWNINTVEGLTEACLYNILSTPSLVITDSEGKEIKGWKGQIRF